MSTQLSDHGTHYVVSTVAGPGRRKKLPRRAVRVGKGDMGAVKAEIVRQAELIRAEMGIAPK